MAIVLPHIRIIRTIESFSNDLMDEMLHFCLEFSKEKPCYLEVTDETAQLFLFFRERQIYAAGEISEQQVSDLTIKDFLMKSAKLSAPRLYCYSVTNKILHSLLIIFQKKPSINIQTALVDMDKLLDKIEAEGKSCIVQAMQEDFFAVLRYEKGKVSALCHQQSLPYPQESSFREDFLVKIYTLSSEEQLLISLYEDLLVNYASDAKLIGDDFLGSIVDMFLAKPPVAVIKLKNKEVDRLVIDKPEIKIGRTPDNDICIDNLAVSRLHAVIENRKGTYVARDCDSLNGTYLNGKKIGCAQLKNRDLLRIGKHDIIFLEQEGRTIDENLYGEGLDQTIIISGGAAAARELAGEQSPAIALVENGGGTPHPRLIEKTPDGDRIIELLKPALIFGNDESADVSINGFLVAAQHAEIVRRGDHYIIRHLRGFRKVKVGGKSVNESVLKPNDTIEIANREFTFLE